MSSAAQQTESVSQIELPPSLWHDRRFLFNRELSWLEFNRRVLEEANAEAYPLLERLKFLSIYSTNLDEFFMIRVSGLKEQIDEGVLELSPDGMTAQEQLREIRLRLQPMIDEQMRCLREEIMPALASAGISVLSYDSLSDDEKNIANQYFTENVFPVLTPQAVDASHPFPYISNLSLNLAVVLAQDGGNKKGRKSAFESRFARVKLPSNVPRLIPVNGEQTRFTLLGELIKANINALFPGMQVLQAHLFRVTRDADIELREDEAGDLLSTMEQELHRRRFRDAVRLEVTNSMPEDLIAFLTKEIELDEEDVYRIDGFLNTPDLMRLYGINRPDLKDRPLLPITPRAFRQGKSFFAAIGEADVVLHHPFTNYNTVTDFINAAADDEDVQAIKICLYRTGKNSPIVEALVRASVNGKQVAALVELKARFDEENNIEWARRLESEGVHVVYGMRGLKTHSKLALVVRREGGKLRRYVHVATGNYNPTTAKIYTDLGILTANEEIGADATDIFNYLTGYSNQNEFRGLLVAPVTLRAKMVEMIRRETENARQNRPARIIAKMNSLTDVEMTHALYEAAQAGVEIDLIIRGICVLRPGVEGLSENIRVRSLVGRFLEHSRIFYFENGGDEEIYIGSADWMKRNLDRRVEVVAPILSPKIKRYLQEEILTSYLRDNVKARMLQPDGSYQQIKPQPGEEEFAAQDYFAGRAI
ncbi:MAG TPA: polyphosphate kinase 1 [Pyrinomonadaceae bacterium]|nr:polyphosphate kinase 1 [Pyrinomonadaceae bacterium]